MHLLKILKSFYKSSILSELEYRSNFLINAVVGLAWLLSAIGGVSVFYFYTDHLGGWVWEEALIVLGLFAVVMGFIDSCLRPNIREIVEMIRTGTLDFVLLKPINSQFHASLRHFVVWKLFDVVSGIGLIIFAYIQLGKTPSLIELLTFGAMVITALIIVYSLLILIVTTSFWFVDVKNMVEFIYILFQAGRFPITVYPQPVRFILTFVIPVAFITTIPAEAILGQLKVTFFILSFILSSSLLLLSTFIWKRALRQYTSASS